MQPNPKLSPQGGSEKQNPQASGAIMGGRQNQRRQFTTRRIGPGPGTDPYGDAVRNLAQPQSPQQPQYASSQGAYPQGAWQQGWPR